MTSSLDEALKRSALSSSNQMEMLTFRLMDNQLYGINVFKIIEIIECPRRLDRVPQSHQAVKGVLDFRGKAVTVIDLSEAVGLQPSTYGTELAYIIICEYNRTMIAFIVQAPDTLLTRSWSEIHKPEGVYSRSLVAIAYADSGETIMLLDIESILAEVIGIGRDLSHVAGIEAADMGKARHVLIVDDSRTALMLMQSVLEKMGLSCTAVMSADKALQYLEEEQGNVDLVISDIEMPGMDGFTFTRTIRDHDDYRHLKVILHSSMSNPSNKLKAEQSGANTFVAKFDPEILSEEILRLITA